MMVFANHETIAKKKKKESGFLKVWLVLNSLIFPHRWQNIDGARREVDIDIERRVEEILDHSVLLHEAGQQKRQRSIL